MTHYEIYLKDNSLFHKGTCEKKAKMYVFLLQKANKEYYARKTYKLNKMKKHE